MPKTIISDASCFIVLTKIEELDLLQRCYGRVITTIEIAAEYGQQFPDWVEIKEVFDKKLQSVLELQVDKGEASAIALAMETPESTVILDDYKARQLATKLGLYVTGTIGVIIKAKLESIVPSIKPYLDKIHKTDFRFTEELEQQALRLAGE